MSTISTSPSTKTAPRPPTSHHPLQARKLQDSKHCYSPRTALPSEDFSVAEEEDEYTLDPIDIPLRDNNFFRESPHITLPTHKHSPGNTEGVSKNLYKEFKPLKGAQAPKPETPTPILREARGKAVGRKGSLGVSLRKLSTTSRDHIYPMQPKNHPLVQVSGGGTGDGITQPSGPEAVDNRKYVGGTCRKVLDKFIFRPQNSNSKNRGDLKTKEENKHVNCALEGKGLISGEGSIGIVRGIMEAREDFVEPRAYTYSSTFEAKNGNLIVEEKLADEDSEFSEYGSDSGFYELFPMLDAPQELTTQLNNIPRREEYPQKNPCIIEDCGQSKEDEEFGGIGDSEMLEAMARLDDHGLLKWNIDPNLTGNEKKNIIHRSGEQPPHPQSPPITPHKLLQGKPPRKHPTWAQQQFISPVSNNGSHILGLYPVLGVPPGSEFSDIVEEDFSLPSNVVFALNDYSQEQEIFDLNLQGSPPAQDDMEFGGNIGLFPGDVETNGIQYACEEIGIFGSTNDAEKWILGSNEVSSGGGEEILDVGGVSQEEQEVKEQEEQEPGIGELFKKIWKAKQKGQSMRAEWRGRPPKKRVRICDPSQSKLSDYIGFDVPSPSSLHQKRYAKDGSLNPFVRPSFLPMVPEKPSVVGISNRFSVKTCFRIGEALRVARMAASGNLTGDVLVELYARVGFSERVSLHQNFQFIDIFHDKPPFLNGTLAKACHVWGENSSAFLGNSGKGKMARVVGRMQQKNGGEGITTFVIKISSIWEADWKAVDWTRGIICGSSE